MNKSTQKRIEIVRKMVDAYYEEGSQETCKLQVYRRHIAPSMGISQRTFFRYLSATLEEAKPQPMQLEFDFM